MAAKSGSAKKAQDLFDDPKETDFKPDTSAKVNPEKDLDDESKADWMKRRAKEDKVAKEGAKEVKCWYEERNGKLLKRVKKKNGNVHSMYIGKVKKCKDLIETLKKQGKMK